MLVAGSCRRADAVGQKEKQGSPSRTRIAGSEETRGFWGQASTLDWQCRVGGKQRIESALANDHLLPTFHQTGQAVYDSLRSPFGLPAAVYLASHWFRIRLSELLVGLP